MLHRAMGVIFFISVNIFEMQMIIDDYVTVRDNACRRCLNTLSDYLSGYFNQCLIPQSGINKVF